MYTCHSRIAIFPSQSPSAIDARARRAAKRVGLRIAKTRWRKGTIDNMGGYQILDLYSNCVFAGYRFDMSAEEVIEYCS